MLEGVFFERSQAFSFPQLSPLSATTDVRSSTITMPEPRSPEQPKMAGELNKRGGFHKKRCRMQDNGGGSGPLCGVLRGARNLISKSVPCSFARCHGCRGTRASAVVDSSPHIIGRVNHNGFVGRRSEEQCNRARQMATGRGLEVEKWWPVIYPGSGIWPRGLVGPGPAPSPHRHSLSVPIASYCRRARGEVHHEGRGEAGAFAECRRMGFWNLLKKGCFSVVHWTIHSSVLYSRLF